MYLTIKQEAKLSKEELNILKELSHTAKSLYNEALYSIRQYFFNTGSYLNYYDNYKELKNSVNYKLLNSNMSQQILKEVDGSFKSFFKLLQMKKNKEYEGDVSIPHYLDKDGYSVMKWRMSSRFKQYTLIFVFLIKNIGQETSINSSSAVGHSVIRGF